MKKLVLVAALSAFGGAIGVLPLSDTAVHAQTSSAQQAVQAQLIALAQAGNWAAFQTLVATQISQGNASMLATIASNISSMGLAIVDSDSASAVALQLAAMAIVDNNAVVVANPGVGSVVGSNAGQVKAKIARRNPAGAAALASAAARSSAPGLMLAYNTGQSGNQQTGSTNTPVVVVVRQNPPRPDTPEIPIVPEPNPLQSGSPT